MRTTFETSTKSSLRLLPALVAVALSTPFFSAAKAQESPRLVLTDSRGTELTSSITIGLTLLAGIEEGRAGHLYQIVLYNEVGDLVAETFGSTNRTGDLPPKNLWKKTGVVGCDPPLAGDGLPPAPDGYLFPTFEEAAQVLAGRIFVAVLVDPENGAWVDTVNLAVEESPDPIYFFSDDKACPRAQFNGDEKIYLSVTHGSLAPSTNSRVFVIKKPVFLLWNEGYNFADIRQPETCADPQVTECPVFPEGEITDLPQTQTVELTGPFPQGKEMIAVVRHATDHLETQRLECDQASEYSMYYYEFLTGPHNTDPNESWGCPPCPPG